MHMDRSMNVGVNWISRSSKDDQPNIYRNVTSEASDLDSGGRRGQGRGYCRAYPSSCTGAGEGYGGGGQLIAFSREKRISLSHFPRVPPDKCFDEYVILLHLRGLSNTHLLTPLQVRKSLDFSAVLKRMIYISIQSITGEPITSTTLRGVN